MAKNNDDFFAEKKPWSEVKDQLLACYLKPYIQKVLNTQKPIVYVDCFAGKGMFEDGKPGSPIIALQIIRNCTEQTKMCNFDIKSFFIELNHASDLLNNLNGYDDIQIISGKYEENIEDLLSGKEKCNVFLYIDPYGIKALKFSLFRNFSSVQKLSSIELLINLNSFGFIREGCRVLGASFGEESIFDDLIEYDRTQLEVNEQSIFTLSEIAGGDYWIKIIESYRLNRISIHEAENIFVAKYCEKLKQYYAYVLNMPLRIKRGQIPKYRMIHVTNHVEGCLLMVDNINSRWELIKDIQNQGQMLIWNEDFENKLIEPDEIQSKVIDQISDFTNFTRLNPILAEFFMKYGPICSTKIVKDIIRKLISQEKLDVRRTPQETPNGKPSSFLSDERGKKIELRWHS